MLCYFVDKQSEPHRAVSGQLLPVRLATAIDHRAVVAQVTIDVDILSSDLPERRHVLECILETVGRPVVNITIIKGYFSSDDDVHMLKESEVKRRANEICLVENDCASTVAVLERLQDSRRIVAGCAVGGSRLDVAVAALVPRWRVGEFLASAVWSWNNYGTLWEGRGAMAGTESST